MLALHGGVAEDALVIFWFILPPLILYFTLALVLYLSVIELRTLKPHWKWWIWWLSFVGLTHFIGYFALRGYVAYRRSHSASA
jgi:hypothetical protein